MNIALIASGFKTSTLRGRARGCDAAHADLRLVLVVGGPMDVAEYLAQMGPALHRLAFTLTGNASSAEDLVQEALVKATRSWVRLRSATNLDAYVKRMIVNVFIDGRRKKSAHEVPADLGHLADQSVAPSHAESIEDRDLMWALLRRLPRRQRAVLVLRYYEDMTDARIAQTIGCQESTVRSQASRGLASLRESWLDSNNANEGESVR